jgi:uncharacterized protein with PIN domain
MDRNERHSRETPSSCVPAFDVDGTLGALAKWLRIVGFDAAYPRTSPTIGRIFVTMRLLPDGSDKLRVDNRDPVSQLKQVIDYAGIVLREDLLLSRCLLCNVPVREISPDQAAAGVPHAILRTVRVFHECPQCHRVYWEGSHSERIKKRLKESGIAVK